MLSNTLMGLNFAVQTIRHFEISFNYFVVLKLELITNNEKQLFVLVNKK
jgi:hypothetical protein